MRGWYSRGYLPHLDEPGKIQFLTYRLFDSLPKSVLDTYDEAVRRGEIDDIERLRKIEGYLDKGKGACWLRIPDVARLVEDNLLHFDGTRYRVLAWCVMPNHVHVVAEMWEDYPLDDVAHSWKSYTAHRLNKIVGRSGHVWQREVFDRYMRNEQHLMRTVEYVEENPVLAGLVDRAADWPFSSSRLRDCLNSRDG